MAEIRKKIWPEYFEQILSGKKKFELRLNDFEIQEGDTLVLEEWNPEKKEYTGRKIEKKVAYILKFKADELPYYSPEEVQQHGLQILSLE